MLINRGHLGLFTEARQIKRFPILPTTLRLQLMMALVRVYHGSDVWITSFNSVGRNYPKPQLKDEKKRPRKIRLCAQGLMAGKW